MSDQTYANHTRLYPPFHFVLLPALLAGVIGSFVNLRHSLGDSQRLYSASLIVLLTVGMVLVALFAGAFALRAQDQGDTRRGEPAAFRPDGQVARPEADHPPDHRPSLRVRR